MAELAVLNENELPVRYHILIIGDSNYRMCQKCAEKNPRNFTEFPKLQSELNPTIHRIYIPIDKDLKAVIKEYEKHKEQHGLPHIVMIQGGNKDLARSMDEQVVITKLCRIAKKMRTDGVYAITICSLLPVGIDELWEEYNAKVDRINMKLATYLAPMGKVNFLNFFKKPESEFSRNQFKMLFDPKNKRYLSRTAFVIIEQQLCTLLMDKLIPSLKNKKIEHQHNIRRVISVRSFNQINTTKFVNSEARVTDLRESLAELEKSKVILMENKKKLEFMIKIANDKLNKSETYTDGVKALISYMQDNSALS